MDKSLLINQLPDLPPRALVGEHVDSPEYDGLGVGFNELVVGHGAPLFFVKGGGAEIMAGPPFPQCSEHPDNSLAVKGVDGAALAQLVFRELGLGVHETLDRHRLAFDMLLGDFVGNLRRDG